MANRKIQDYNSSGEATEIKLGGTADEYKVLTKRAADLLYASGSVNAGSQGVQGIQGPQGIPGPRGVVGLVGPAGTTGLTGADSTVAGPAGIDGVGINVMPPVVNEVARLLLSTSWQASDAGKSVVQVDDKTFWTWSGTAWIDASNLVGPTGMDGNDGVAGLQGIPGVQGAQGLDGSGGVQGIQGLDGVQGSPGVGINVLPPVADTARRNALSVGWDATDAGKAVIQLDSGEFWSYTATGWVNAGTIAGVEGRQGVQGVAGGQGVAGPQGPRGVKGDTGLDSSVAGPQGPDGVAGIDGVGINVLPPVADTPARDLLGASYTVADAGKSVLTIDDNTFWTWSGNLWMDASTLVGPQGPAGQLGPVGKVGKTGPIGPDGVAGPQGITGVAGTDGIIGVDGKHGVDGIKTRVTGNVLYISTDGSQP